MIDQTEAPAAGYDIVFVNPAHHGPDYYAPIGIGMLATLVRQRGYRTAILDFQRDVVGRVIPWPEGFFQAAEARLAGTKATIFGFTVMNVGLPWAVRLARIVRAHHPSAKIVFGGPHATLLGREILKYFPEIDLIALNEGEQVIVPLVEALLTGGPETLRRVPNMLIREQDGRIHKTDAVALTPDLDTLPLLDIDPGILNTVEIVSVEAGRGCPYSCSFCSSHAIWTRKPRFKSPERLVQEAARYVKAAPGDLFISYEHDDFLANRPLFRRFAESKIRSGETFKYGITTRLDHITDEVRGILAESGCVSVFMGIETGSAAMQVSSSKHLRLRDVLPRINGMMKSGIHVSTNFIVGFPGETWADLFDSVEMMLAIGWMGATVNISVMCPEPGSQLFIDTPTRDHVLLRDSAYVEELARGGISVQELTDVERFHLLTIRSGNFDIEEVARLARSLQLLIAEFPLALYNLAGTLGGAGAVVWEILDYQRRIGRRITASDAFEFFICGLKDCRAPRAMEYLLYESCRSSLKHGDGAVAYESAFGADMPGAYHEAVAGMEVPAARHTSTPAEPAGHENRVPISSYITIQPYAG